MDCSPHLGKDAKRPPKEYLRHLRDAAERYEQALGMLPLNATSDLAVVHNELGLIYAEARQIEAAIGDAEAALGELAASTTDSKKAVAA